MIVFLCYNCFIKERRYKMTEELVKILIKKRLEIATMESCTGGALANAITSVEGSSEILKFSAVTYSNEYKIKLGVSPEVIDKYSVYSIETAKEMSKNISNFAHSDIGIGITGKLNRMDPNNPYGKDNIIYISIYQKTLDQYTTYEVQTKNEDRATNKKWIVEYIITNLMGILS